MKLYLPLALAKNLEAAKSDRGGIDGQMQRANARAARNLRHDESLSGDDRIARQTLIPTALSTDLFPSPGGDGSDGLWVVGEEVPGLAAGFDDVVVAVEHGDGELDGAQVGPDVFDG